MKTLRNSVFYLLVASLAALCSVDTALAQANTITPNPSVLTFSSASGTPQPQNVSVTSAVQTGIGFTVSYTSANNWLGVVVATPTATPTSTNNLIAYVANPQQAAGSYPGTITLIPTTGPTVLISATYNVNVTGTNPVTASVSSLTFNVAAGSSLSSQSFSLSSTSGSVGVNLTTSVNAGIGWLSVNPSSATVVSGTPINVLVSVSPGTLPTGTYTGAVNVLPAGSSTPLAIPVTLNVGSTAGSGALSATPNSLVFSFSNGSAVAQTQPLTVSTTANQVESVTATPSTQQGSGWLAVNGTINPVTVTITSSVSAALQVSVDPKGLATGTYNGTIVLSAPGASPVTISVVVNIGTNGSSEISATPNPINFNIATGSSQTSDNQQLTVTTASGTVTYTATAQTNTGGDGWLSVNPPTAQTVTPTASSSLTVSVNPSTLTAGTYTGTVTLTPADGSTPLIVPVNVTVGSSPSLTISPAVLSFAYQTGTPFPQPQVLQLSSSGAALPFSISSSTSGGNWLVISPQNGATSAQGGAPSSVTVQVSPNGLAAGTYTGTITVTSAGASTPTQTIQVNLLVSNLPIVTLGTSAVTFSYQYQSTTLPAQQQVSVSSSGNQLPFTASVAPGSGGGFLNVTPSTGTTPTQLSLSINPTTLATLAPGSYQSTVTIAASGAGNTPVNLPVTLVIGNNTLINLSQTSLAFNYQIGQGNPSSQTIEVSSSGTPITYTVSSTSTNCGGNFLTATSTSGTTPGSVVVGINTPGLTAGTCTGSVTLSSTTPSVGNSPLTIPVTVTVSTSPLLNVSPAAINLTAQFGTSPAGQTIALTSTDPAVALPFNVTSTTTTSSGWLLVGPTSGSTPTNLTVGFQTSGLAVGTYTGSITVTPTAVGSMPTVIPVTVVITTAATASAAPSSLTFTQPLGGQAPASQMVNITSSVAGLTYSVSASVVTPAGGNWLTVTSANGTTPGTFTVTANGTNLNQGSYTGIITVLIPGAGNTPINIPVTLTVTSAQAITLGSSSVTFTYQAGATTGPAAQMVQITSTGGPLPFTATASSTPTGLINVTPASGTTPAPISISFNQSVLATLAAGSYTGTVTIASPNLPGGSQVINVNLTVQPMAPPSVTSVVNSATSQAGPVAPGEIVSIYGSSIGSATPTGLVVMNGLVTTMLDNTQVLFDGVAAPLIYVSSGQINAVVPYSVGSLATTNVTVQRNGVTSASLQLRVQNTSPAIFSLSMGGNGQGAIINQDGTVNGTSAPATKGSIISIYATGEGTLNPQPATGQVTSTTGPYPLPTGLVSLTIGGQPAQIQYAGEAPGFVSGVLQINAVVPTTISGTGPQNIVLTIGTGTNAQQTITVVVQ